MALVPALRALPVTRQPDSKAVDRAVPALAVSASKPSSSPKLRNSGRPSGTTPMPGRTETESVLLAFCR